MSQFVPVPDPAGSMDPPRHNAPATFATDTPEAEPSLKRDRSVGDTLTGLLTALARSAPPSGALRDWATRALDFADLLAAPIAGALRQR